MKKIIVLLILACSFSAASANFDAKANAFVQPFSKSYAFSYIYLWYTDIDLTDPVGSYCDIWTEMAYLRNTFPGYSFTNYNYGGLYEFEYGYCAPLYFATIYSDLRR